MINNIFSPEERRLIIIRGINKGHTTVEIANEIGVRGWVVFNDLKAMKRNDDSDLKQAYLEREIRITKNKQSKVNLRDEKFLLMMGKTHQEKNFENMIDYYKKELQRIRMSPDERIAISGLSRNIRRTLKRNDITTGHGLREQLSEKARDYLKNFNQS
jgi:hypothetical protein